MPVVFIAATAQTPTHACSRQAEMFAPTIVEVVVGVPAGSLPSLVVDDA